MGTRKGRFHEQSGDQKGTFARAACQGTRKGRLQEQPVRGRERDVCKSKPVRGRERDVCKSRGPERDASKSSLPVRKRWCSVV